MTAVHQFIPTFATRDAVGSHTLQVQCLLRDLGFDSEIYAAAVTGDTRDLARSYLSFRGRERSSTWLLYQASVGSFLADHLLRRPEPKIVNYHNITPVEYFEGWEPSVAVHLVAGRHQLRRLAADTALGIADSDFNGRELTDLGYRDVRTVPILLDLETFERAVDQAALDRFLAAKSAGGADWLFVGRLAPNKCQHEVVKAFAAYRRACDPVARLRLVGGPASDAYRRTITEYVAALDLSSAVELCGSLSEGELAAAYRAADVFVCLSEHEGFCVPLLEAMHHRLPIVAYAAAAVPETLRDAGILLPRKNPELVAEAVHRVLTDAGVRDALHTAAAARLADFELDKTRAAYAAAVLDVVGEAR